MTFGVLEQYTLETTGGFVRISVPRDLRTNRIVSFVLSEAHMNKALVAR